MNGRFIEINNDVYRAEKMVDEYMVQILLIKEKFKSWSVKIVISIIEGKFMIDSLLDLLLLTFWQNGSTLGLHQPHKVITLFSFFPICHVVVLKFSLEVGGIFILLLKLRVIIFINVVVERVIQSGPSISAQLF